MRIVCRLTAALVMLLPALPAAAMPAFLSARADQTLTYSVVRNGETIGSHSYTFRTRPDGGTVVTIHATIRVSILMVTAYSFEQHGTELWENDHLKAMDFFTDDDGLRHKVEAEVSRSRMTVSVDGKPPVYHPEMLPATLWHIPSPQTNIVLDPADGDATPIKTSYAGEDTITVRGRPLKAQHWVWDGGLKRDLWYDGNQALVQVRIKGDDDSDVFYVLK
ncbi:MAG: hypothetical protein HY055_10070 [Magnetospirillum sp.]|nr:hypothetical protein [Magnetospirillum sp.]